jgi:hypothetical protein
LPRIWTSDCCFQMRNNPEHIVPMHLVMHFYVSCSKIIFKATFVNTNVQDTYICKGHTRYSWIDFVNGLIKSAPGHKDFISLGMAGRLIDKISVVVISCLPLSYGKACKQSTLLVHTFTWRPRLHFLYCRQ